MAGNSTVAAMTAASALSGSELFYGVQSGNDRKITATQIQTFVGSGITIGTTAITSGTTTRFLYDLAGVVSETAGLTYTAATGQVTNAQGTLTASAPFTLTQTWNSSGVTFNALLVNVTSTASAAASLLMDLQVGGTSVFKIVKDATILVPDNARITRQLGVGGIYFAGNNRPVASSGFDSGDTITIGATDVILNRDAANTLALRNGTTLQTYNMYATYTDASNYERLQLTFGASVAYLITGQAGTGVARPLTIGTLGAAAINFRISNVDIWSINTSGHLLALTDNTYDIGASGATRPRAVYVAGLGTFGGLLTSAGLTTSSDTTYTVAAKGPILKQGANGRVGTFTANGVTPVTVTNSSVAVTDTIIISLNTVGGTVAIQPVVDTITAATSFTVKAGVGDTSVYNYAIIKNSA